MATVPVAKRSELKELVLKKSTPESPKAGRVTKRGQNLLMLYVWYAEPPLPEVVEYMLTVMMINPMHLDETGWSALHYAASNPFVNLDTLDLLSCTAKVVSHDGQNALMMHLQYSNHHINNAKVRLLIQAGCDPSMLEPFYYYEIESEVLAGLIADRICVLKLLENRKQMEPTQKLKLLSQNLMRELIKYL